jgi:hypothetical protein
VPSTPPPWTSPCSSWPPSTARPARRCATTSPPGPSPRRSSRWPTRPASPPPSSPTPTWPTLESSHVALFVTSRGGIAAPPYVGFAADDELLGPTAEALAELYRAHGIEVDPHWADLPDHVAAVAEAGLLLLEADRDGGRAGPARAVPAPWFQRYAGAIARRTSAASTVR